MKYIILSFILAVSTVFAQGKTGKITIISHPDNVQIRLDSVLIGSTPLQDFEIPSGAHKIEAISPYSGLWNMDNIREEFTVSSGGDTTIRIQFMTPVTINSIPFHAKLFQGKTALGQTPVRLPFENYRGKEFRLEKMGYQSREFRLESAEPKVFSLKALDGNLSDQENTSFAYSVFHTKLKTKFLFLTGTVVTHWLAFYFKNVADHNYDKYQHTADPAAMNQHWDQMQKYDRLSDVTLGVSYVFLSGLIYSVIAH